MGRPEEPLEPDGSPKVEFAFWLRDLRKQAGLTYQQLGQQAHYSTSTVQAATAGKLFPTLRVTLAIVGACGGDIDGWRVFWHQTRRLLDQDAPDAVRNLAQPPPTRGSSPEVARDRAELGSGQTDQWYIKSLSTLLRLDSRPVEALERRVIVATVDDLEELVSSVSVPRHPDDTCAAHGLETEILHGGSLSRSEQPYESLFRNVVVLPRALRKGERHTYVSRVRIPEGQPMASHYLHVPHCRSDQFELRVRFDPARPPAAVWMLSGAPAAVAYQREVAGERLFPDRLGDLRLTFHSLRPGLCYGVRWQG